MNTIRVVPATLSSINRAFLITKYSMKLIAFGDSHTAGAEIQEPNSSNCYERAYPAKIAKHYGWDWENWAVSGGSVSWVEREFWRRIPELEADKEEFFVLINWPEPARMFFTIEDGKTEHVTSASTHTNWLYRRAYEEWLMRYTDQGLEDLSIAKLDFIAQYLLKEDIPFVMHWSTHPWGAGRLDTRINRRFYGLHQAGENPADLWRKWTYWGHCVNHQDMGWLSTTERWSGHYPEQFHEYWAGIMIKFIDSLS